MAIELIDKIKQKNNGNFKLVDAIDIEMKDGSDLEESISKINTNISSTKDDIDNINEKVSDHLTNHPGGDDIFVGDKEPTDDGCKIWVDISDSDGVTGSITDKVLDEIKSVIQGLANEIVSLKTKIVEHEARIEYLELYGGSGGVTPPPSDNSTALIFEDGSKMVFEDGSVMVFEDDNTNTQNSLLIFEDGSKMVFEDGSKMIFEDELPPTLSDIMLFEDRSKMLFEDNNIMIFE